MACTAWFGLAFLQPFLVQRPETALHQKLGMLGMGIASMVFLSGMWVMKHRVSRFQDLQINARAGNLQAQTFESMLIWGDFCVLLSFVALCYLGFRHRFRPASHKRWMLFASVMIVPQAFVRLGKLPWLQIGSDPAQSGSLYAVLGPVSVLLSLLVYDWLREQRIHVVSRWIWLWYVLLLLSSFVMMKSGWGIGWFSG
ncbi:MAG: hypothetical protein AAF399_02250 [Bacteroidota bacterium]